MRLSQLVPALFLVVVPALGGVGFGQETDTKWLVGVWDARTAFAGFTIDGTAEFKDGGNSWEFEITSGDSAGSKARGSTKVSGDSVEMKGQYYRGPAMGGFSCSLTRAKDILEGVCVGSRNVPTPTSFKKAK